VKHVLWNCEVAKTLCLGFADFVPWVSAEYNVLFVLHWKGEVFRDKWLIQQSCGSMEHDPTNGNFFLLEMKRCHQATFHGMNTPFSLKEEFGFKLDLVIQISAKIAFS
jgi:hypothetical protein